MRPGRSPGRTAADQPVADAVHSNATERPLPAKVEPATRSREKVTAKRYALTKPAANEPGSRPLLLVGARFIMGEAADPGFPQPIGTAVRLAGQAVSSRGVDEQKRGRNAVSGSSGRAGEAQRRRRPDAHQVVIVTASGMLYT